MHPDDLARYRGTELIAVIQDSNSQLELEKLQAETLVHLRAFLEAQGG